MKKHIYFILTILSAGVLMGCEGFLDEKPNKSITVPENIEDLQALLDNGNIFNLHPILDIIAADEYFTTPAGFSSYGSSMIQRAHLWEFETMFEGFTVATEWLNLYTQIYYSNLCLEISQKIIANNSHEAEALANVIGSAYFTRAFGLFNIIRNYGMPYDKNLSSSQIGVPIPLNPDVNNFSEFETVQKAYDQVIDDLEQALRFLPEESKYKSRPSKKAANALMARVYLAQNDFENAVIFSERAMGSGINLLDFESLDPNRNYPIPLGNEEVIYHSNAFQFGFGLNQQTMIDTVLYNSYDEMDLRKQMYFVTRITGAINFKGSFSGTFHLFGGLTDGELLLISAEAKARLGDRSGAAEAIFRLLESRYLNGAISQEEILQKEDLLGFVLEERKKEMVFRGLRWSDLKRFVLLDPGAVKMKRVLGDEVYEFDPRPENFVFPIPEEELNLR